jgi:hypothetical protein
MTSCKVSPHGGIRVAMDTTTAIRELAAANPTACYRTLERKAHRIGLLRGTGDAAAYAALLEARPLCDTDACDDACPYSGRCEA